MATRLRARSAQSGRMPAIRDELDEFLRIPSVSTGGGDAQALTRAAEWVCERIEGAGGEAGA